MNKIKHLNLGRLPKSRKEALDNPVRVAFIDWAKTNENISKGHLEPIVAVLNRPMSLQYDLGINILEPSRSGELELDIL